tara:strand:- start:383 stop:628 length:246 start_codon:yes stop_codon:yes gene_type:complete
LSREFLAEIDKEMSRLKEELESLNGKVTKATELVTDARRRMELKVSELKYLDAMKSKLTSDVPEVQPEPQQPPTDYDADEQ